MDLFSLRTDKMLGGGVVFQKYFSALENNVGEGVMLKYESILFGSNKRLAKRRELHITCNGNDIESGAKVTYLGVTLDQNLSGSSMITKIVRKCNNKTKFLYRNDKNLDKEKQDAFDLSSGSVPF